MIRSFCPAPPDWTIDWDVLWGSFDILQSLEGCPQNPQYHSEGDVAIHTRMVVEELVELPRFRSLPEDDRVTLFVACLLHDVGKPSCTRTDDNGRISSRGHSRAGARMARRLLWEMGLPFAEREEVVGLIRRHQDPFFLVEQEDAERRAIGTSYSVRAEHLALLAVADALGRECEDQERLIQNVGHFEVMCDVLGCRDRPFRFPNAHSRFVYFRAEGGDPRLEVPDDSELEVTVMSGLPGSGKDRWIQQHGGDRPVVSLDAIAEQMGGQPDGSRVEAEARGRALELLHQRESFVWNADNISRESRTSVVDFLAEHPARVEIVYVEASSVDLTCWNRDRPNPVPLRELEDALRSWDVPSLTEAHSVRYMVPHGISEEELGLKSPRPS